jgi:hypothetical protein
MHLPTPIPESQTRRSDKFRTAAFPAATFQAAAIDVLRGALPAALDLRPLAGVSFRITTFEEPGPRGTSRTLVVSGADPSRGAHGADAHVWLVVHHGEVFEQRHTLGGLELRVALSQRHDGGLSVGTSALQCLLYPGEEARVADGDLEFVAHFGARSGSDATYVLADSRLWRSRAR